MLLQKHEVAKEIESGTCTSRLAERYGIFVTTIYNVQGVLAFADTKESIEVPQIDPYNMPDNIEALKKRYAEL